MGAAVITALQNAFLVKKKKGGVNAYGEFKNRVKGKIRLLAS